MLNTNRIEKIFAANNTLLTFMISILNYGEQSLTPQLFIYTMAECLYLPEIILGNDPVIPQRQIPGDDS